MIGPRELIECRWCGAEVREHSLEGGRFPGGASALTDEDWKHIETKHRPGCEWVKNHAYAWRKS